MSNKNIERMVKFVYWKLGKPGRLATQSAVKEAKRAAQEILDAGYSAFNVMEMFTFLDDEPDVQASGFDESMGWWRNQISDLPSLAVVLQKPAPNRFVAQYEQRSAEMKKFLASHKYTVQDWIDNMTAPRKDDPNYEEKVFELLLKDPEKYSRRSPEIEKGFKINIAFRDKLWTALVSHQDGNPEPLVTFLKANLNEAGLQAVLGEDKSDAFPCGVNKLAEVEKLVPYKNRLPAPQTESEKKVMAFLKLCGVFGDLRRKYPKMTREQAAQGLDLYLNGKARR
jgi:hypothetical protein